MARAFVVAFLILARSAAAQESAPGLDSAGAAVTWGADVVIASAYVWRGEAELTHLHAQPTLWVAAGPFSVTSWMAVDGRGVFEHDTSIEMEGAFGPLTASGGVVNYFVPSADTGRYSNDAYAGVALPWVLTPSLTVWQGLAASPGRYVEAAVSGRFGRRLGFEPRLAVGRSSGATPVATHLEGTLAVEWNAGPATMRPFISHVQGMGDGPRRRTYGGLQVEFQP